MRRNKHGTRRGRTGYSNDDRSAPGSSASVRPRRLRSPTCRDSAGGRDRGRRSTTLRSATWARPAASPARPRLQGGRSYTGDRDDARTGGARRVEQLGRVVEIGRRVLDPSEPGPWQRRQEGDLEDLFEILPRTQSPAVMQTQRAQHRGEQPQEHPQNRVPHHPRSVLGDRCRVAHPLVEGSAVARCLVG